MYCEVQKQEWYQDDPQYRGVLGSCNFHLEISIMLKLEDISNQFGNDASNMHQFIMSSGQMPGKSIKAIILWN